MTISTTAIRGGGREVVCTCELAPDLLCPVHGEIYPQMGIADLERPSAKTLVGWLCPACGKSNAPTAMKCGHCPVDVAVSAAGDYPLTRLKDTS